jgi:signal peptidase I
LLAEQSIWSVQGQKAYLFVPFITTFGYLRRPVSYKVGKSIVNYSITLALLLLLSLLYLRNSLVIVAVQGSSMWPTLQPGDRVLVWRHYLPRWLKMGQIVLVEWQHSPSVGAARTDARLSLVTRPPLIKRVVGLPGDRIVTRITDLSEFEQQSQLEFYDEKGERVWYIPNNHFFIKSDNRGLDSAILGPLPFSDLLGVALMKLPAKHVRDIDTKRIMIS